MWWIRGGGTNYVTIWRIRIACRISKATCRHAHSHVHIYIYCFSTTTVIREHASVSRCTYIACLVFSCVVKYPPQQKTFRTKMQFHFATNQKNLLLMESVSPRNNGLTQSCPEYRLVCIFREFSQSLPPLKLTVTRSSVNHRLAVLCRMQSSRN
jgi:hypothetical protein